MQLQMISKKDISISDSLFSFALPIEAADVFDHCRHIVTGAGKINTAYSLTKAIHENRPSLIINLGSVGSSHLKRGTIVCCTRFIQRDMDARGLGCKPYETPFSNVSTILQYGLQFDGLSEAICGTGDNFETNHLSTDYDVVDMEAYALALIAMKESIPFLCLKYVSDGADGKAAEDWPVQVRKTAMAFRELLF